MDAGTADISRKGARQTKLPDTHVYCQRCNCGYLRGTAHKCRIDSVRRSMSNPAGSFKATAAALAELQEPKTSKFPATPKPEPKGPNQTEREARDVLNGICKGDVWHCGADTLALSNGHEYTPDLRSGFGRAEVKGDYEHGNRYASRLRFDDARVEFPQYQWIWIEKRKATRGKAQHWRVEVY